MPMTWFRTCEVTSANTIKVGENSRPYKTIYLPFCPHGGKEAECKQHLEELLSKENGVSALVDRPGYVNPIIYDVRCDSINKPISDILVERGLAIKWNWPGR
jgi:hypothetical protein